MKTSQLSDYYCHTVLTVSSALCVTFGGAASVPRALLSLMKK